MNDTAPAQNWLTTTLILSGVALAGVLAVGSSSSQPSVADTTSNVAEGTSEAVAGIVQGVTSSHLGQAGGRLAELLIGNVADAAIAQVKAMARDFLENAETITQDYLKQAEALVDAI